MNMKFSNVRLFVTDFEKCFKFYKDQLGLEPAWGDENSGYASFKVAEGIEGFALFMSDWMAPSAGNIEKPMPVNCREKMMVSFNVPNVDEAYAELSSKGVTFIGEPTDMPGWGMRVVYLRGPEENLIDIPNCNYGITILGHFLIKSSRIPNWFFFPSIYESEFDALGSVPPEQFQS